MSKKEPTLGDITKDIPFVNPTIQLVTLTILTNIAKRYVLISLKH